MASWMWILIVIAVLAVALLAAGMMRQRRTATLQHRFGPEYDRTMQEHDGRRAAESHLRGRVKERARLDIRPLAPAARDRAIREWSDLQARFVDQPSTAVLGADDLICRVMRERGYPGDDFDTRVHIVSVDHPSVVGNFRVAHDIYLRAQTQQASTEDLREAMLRYRSLFEDLLGPQPADGYGPATYDGPGVGGDSVARHDVGAGRDTYAAPRPVADVATVPSDPTPVGGPAPDSTAMRADQPARHTAPHDSIGGGTR